MKRALLIGVFAVVGVLACRRAQSQSVLSHDARLPTKFGMLSNVVELSNGVVVFADTRSKLFLRGIVACGFVVTVGRGGVWVALGWGGGLL